MLMNAADRHDPFAVLKRAATVPGRSLRRASVALLMLAGALALLLFGAGGVVQAQTEQALVSNIGQISLGTLAFPLFDIAQEFTTGPNPTGYTLFNIELELEVSGVTDLPTVKLFSGSATFRELATLRAPKNASPGNRVTYTYGVSDLITLEPDTKYWVVAEDGSGLWTAVGTGEDETRASGWSIANTFEARDGESTGAFTIQPQGTFALKTRVNGRINPPQVTLVSNTSQGGDSNTIISSADQAQAFTTGSNVTGYTVSSVTIISEDTEGDDINLQICGVDGNVHPTTACKALTSPDSFASGPLVFTASTRFLLKLAADTTYAVVISSPGEENVTVDATWNDGEDTSSLPDWSIRNKSQVKRQGGWEDRGYDIAVRIAIHSVFTNLTVTGTPAIRGVALVGQTLTASTAGIADPNGLPSAFTYQWKRYAADGTTFEANIGGNSSTYTLTQSDEGKKVLVEVSFTDNSGYSEGPLVSAVYPSSGTVGAVPLVSNTGRHGTDLTYISDDHAQAFTTGSNVTGYTVTGVTINYEDNGDYVGLQICEVDGNVHPTTDCTDLNPPNSIVKGPLFFPAPPGTPLTLEADTTYTVVFNSPAGAWVYVQTTLDRDDTSSSPGWSIRDKYQVKNTSAWRDTDTVSSLRIAIQGTVNEPPAPATGTPAISGVALVGQTLTASTAGIVDPNGLPSAFTYEWKRYAVDGITFEANLGGNSGRYTLTQNELGKKVKVEVSFTDLRGSNEGPLVSAVYPSSGTVDVAPLVSNTSQGDDSNANVTRDHGQAFTTGSNATGYTVTGVTIVSEDGESDDIALQICGVDGSIHPTTTCTNLTSPGSFAKGPLAFTAPTGTPLTLSAGTTYMVVFKSPGGDEVRVDATTSDDEDSSSLPSWSIRDLFQWNNTQDVWQDGSRGGAIRIVIQGTVTNVTATGTPAIRGVALVGQTLTASTAGIVEPNGLPNAFTYQWKRYAADGTTFEANLGGNSGRYTLTQNELGKKVKVEVSFTDLRGSNEGPLVSAVYPSSGMVGVAPLVSNTSQGDDSNVSYTGDHGQAFTTGYNLTGYTVTSVTIVSEDGESDDIALQICGVDGSGHPTAACTALTEPDSFAAGPLVFNASTGSPLTLSSRTTYMVVFKSPGGQDVIVDATTRNAEDSSSLLGWSIRDRFQLYSTPNVWLTGSGGRAIRIAIQATVNPPSTTAPTAMDSTVTAIKETPYTFAADDFNFSARTPGDTLASVWILGPPVRGTLTLNGVAVTLGQSVSKSQLDAGNLVYRSAGSLGYGPGYGRFHFRVSGGSEASTGLYRMTIDVNEVNDPATGTPTISGIALAGHTLTASTAGIVDLNGVPRVFTYQWKRYAADGTTFEANIGGNSGTYTLTQNELGKKVKVEVRFTDNSDSSEGPLLSAAYPSSGTVQSATVSFGASSYTVAEGGSQSMTVTLSADPERRVTIPIAAMPQGDTTAADYSVPTSVTFNPGEMSQTITFNATQDTDDDDGESVVLAFGTLPPAVSLGTTTQATVSITDDDDPPVAVSYGQAAYTVAEGESQSMTVTLSADPERTVLIPLTAMPQGDTTAADYSVPTSVTFNPGEMSQTITFNATQDEIDDDGESVVLAFGTLPPAVSLGTTTQATVSITDDDDPPVAVWYGASSYTVAEGGSQSVTVTLSADPERTVLIPLTATPQGDATAADYSVPTSVTFNVGEMSQTITFNATQDEIDDDGESVVLAFGTLPSGVSAGITTQATVSITDDDDPQVAVSYGQATYTVAEGESQSMTVTLSADPERTVLIPLTATPQGDATAADYSVPTSVTFNAGEMSQTITFNATQDDINDDGESVVLAFGTLPSGVSAGTQATVSITDDDDPQVAVSFGQAAYTVAEGESQSMTVTLSADPERTVLIPLTATPQGDTTAADYSVPTSVTFNAGEMSQTITFNATQDDINDDGESVVLAFGTLPSGVSAGTQATVSINDDDGAGVSVSEASLSIAEGSSGTYTIVLDSQPTADVTVTINDPSGNTDVTAEPASLTFSSTDWNSPKTETVNAGQDVDAEDETGTVTHTVASTDSSYSGASANTVVVRVIDDDDVPVSVSYGQATYTVAEGGTQSVTVTLSADPERTVFIPLTAMPQGDATAADYSVPTSVTFNMGEMSQTITFNATQDEIDDDGESVVLGFGTLPSGVSAGITTQATVSITDDDDPQVAVSYGQATYTVAEGESQSMTVTLSADPERTVLIPLTAMPQGDATAADYSVPTSVTFNAGEMSQTITFNATQDDINDDGESVVLAFGTLPSGVSAGTQATVSITDDDDPQVAVSYGQATYTVAEGESQSVTVTLSADPERTVLIPLTATPQGDATAADYSVPTSVTFNAGEMSQTITFNATQDDIDDDGESVVLAFGTLPSGVSAGTQATVSITDDDDPPVAVSFGQAAYTVAEGGSQSMTVTLSADPERTVLIPLTATPQGDATAADYSVPTSVTFNAGEMSQTITFNATQDDIDDDGESVVLGFGAILPSGISAGTQATVSINDDDGAGVSLFEASLIINEGGSGTYTIVLDSQPTADVTVTINDPSGNTDVTAEPASLTFSSTDWSLQKTVTVNAAQDVDAEDETVTVTHTVASTDSNYSGASVNTVVVRVIDYDDVSVSVSYGQATYTVAEGGTQSVTVTLSANPERTVFIPLTAMPQGDTTAADYSVPTSVTFNMGEMSQTITFNATQDEIDDDGESVVLGFGTLPPAVSLGTTTQATVSITDDDDPPVSFGASSDTVPDDVFDVGHLNVYWMDDDADGNVLWENSCTGSKSFRVIWAGPHADRGSDGNRRADEWDARISTDRGAGTVNYSFMESPGQRNYFEMNGTVNFEGPGSLSLNVRGRLGSSWGSWSPTSSLYCFEEAPPN